jgi:hypothetical protein
LEGDTLGIVPPGDAEGIPMAVHGRHQYRLAMCGHKAVEVAGVCMLLMVQGNIAGLTVTHLGVATQTGLLAVVPVLGITLTRYVHHLANRWVASAVLAVCTFVADAAIHGSHYPGAYSEAALTAVGAFVFSVVVSYTPLGHRIDALIESFVAPEPIVGATPAPDAPVASTAGEPAP